MKTTVITTLCLLGAVFSSCNGNGNDNGDGDGGNNSKKGVEAPVLADQNILRAMDIIDVAIPAYFKGSEMLLSERYNPYTKQVAGTGGSDASVWKYTSAIQAVNAILDGLIAHREHGNAKLYDDNFERYSNLLTQLFKMADYYKGTYVLTSYTQTKEWSVYAVPRGASPGGADPGGDNHKLNVYDDQMWFIRELILAYKATGKAEYLEEAEYLTAYVLDGWDCTLDANGIENGGIPWGPGYVTKHACSNGPMISPLVWLHELYKDRSDEITYGYIAGDGSRIERTMNKGQYYLDFAQKIYDWQKRWLFSPADGVYWDMRGGCDVGSGGLGCDPRLEVIDGVSYRTHSPLMRSEGDKLTYNSGSMLSAACDLFRATGNASYRADLNALTTASFDFFAEESRLINGYYGWPVRSSFNAWYTGVLFLSYMDAFAASNTEASKCLGSFQQNLDYAYKNFYYEGFLPVDPLAGWSSEPGNSYNSVNVMATCMYVTEYANLAKYELEKSKPS